MKRWTIALALLTLAPAAAWPQTPEIQNEVQKELQQARVYEDLEILRRLLQRRIVAFINTCQKCHAAAPSDVRVLYDGSSSMHSVNLDWGTNPNVAMGGGDMASGTMNPAYRAWARFDRGAAAGPAAEAVMIDAMYVKGQGVIFQVQLPAMLATLSRQAPEHAAKTPRKPVDEWDLIRKELRGEKAQAASAAADDPHQANIEAVLLAALADYGKNVRLTADSERITLSATFRSPDAAPGRDPFSGEPGSGDSDGGVAMRPPGKGPTMPQPTGRGTSKDHELLGDYHLKQGRYADAIKALQKAVELNSDPSRTSGLYRKLAAADLMQHQGDPPSVTLAKVMEYLNKAKASSKATPAAQAARPALPARLVISASRSALEKASPNQLEAFRGQVSVTWLRFDQPVLGGADEAGNAPAKSGALPNDGKK